MLLVERSCAFSNAEIHSNHGIDAITLECIPKISVEENDMGAAAGRPATFAIVGTGWRSQFFLRIAVELPERFAVTGVYSRSDAKREELAHRFGTVAVGSVEEAVRHGSPDFVIVAVPWPAAPGITQQIVELGVAVLEETPPAPDLPAMRDLWSWVGTRDLVQIAEQCMYMPAHRARLRMIREGLIGEPTSVQVSSNHLYHAVSIMRGLLGVGRGPTTVIAHSLSTTLVEPITYGGVYTDNPDPVPRTGHWRSSTSEAAVQACTTLPRTSGGTRCDVGGSPCVEPEVR